MITVVDYGMGNLFSVANALDRLGLGWRMSANPAEVTAAERLILPGVGSFREAMQHLNETGLAQAIRACVFAGRPLLGICLGMQLLADRGTEDATPGNATPGLGLIPGTVLGLPKCAGLKIPHVGFNEVRLERTHPIFDGIDDRSDFYFVHSFHFEADDQTVLARTPHGVPFASVVARGTVVGTQFHPEKSQATGLRLLRNFSRV